MEMETIEDVLEVSASEMVNWDVVERLLSKINEFRVSILTKLLQTLFSINPYAESLKVS
jgi:hypothetical protein